MLFDMDTKQYLPTVLPQQGLSIFFNWIWEMKQVGDYQEVYLVSFGSTDHKLFYDPVCLFHLWAKISFLDIRFLDAQDFLPKYATNCGPGLLSIFNQLFPGERFQHQDARQDFLALKRICERTLEENSLTEKYMVDFFLGNQLWMRSTKVWTLQVLVGLKTILLNF